MADVAHPKVPIRIIPTVSDEHFRRLLELSDPAQIKTSGRRFEAVRNQAMLWLDTPGRKAEIALLTVDDVDLRERRVLVTRKGRKERYMYMGHHHQGDGTVQGATGPPGPSDGSLVGGLPGHGDGQGLDVPAASGTRSRWP